MLFLDLYRVIKSMQHLSFDIDVETDVVRRFPMLAKAISSVPTAPGDRVTRPCVRSWVRLPG